jgi:hypothetical protein
MKKYALIPRSHETWKRFLKNIKRSKTQKIKKMKNKERKEMKTHKLMEKFLNLKIKPSHLLLWLNVSPYAKRKILLLLIAGVLVLV